MNEIRIRPALIGDAQVLARVLVHTSQDTFRGLVPRRCLESPTIIESERSWRKLFRSGDLAKDEMFLVATDERSQITGYALAGRRTDRTDYPREMSSLMVAPPWQRSGIGRKLVGRIAQELHRQGETSLLVGVLRENPNQAFFTRLGARQVDSRPVDWVGYKTEELLFGWDDLALLAKQA